LQKEKLPLLGQLPLCMDDKQTSCVLVDALYRFHNLAAL